jgi:hypothetical protein
METALSTCGHPGFRVLVSSGTDLETAILATEIQPTTCAEIESNEPVPLGMDTEAVMLATEISYTCYLLQIITRFRRQGRF